MFLSILTTITAIVVPLVLLLLLWAFHSHSYWKRKGVFTPPTSFPLGFLKEFISQSSSLSEVFQNYYTLIKAKKLPHGGLYSLHRPVYMPVDPDLVKDIIHNHFEHFTDRGLYYDEEADPISAHLFSLNGTKWKKLRAKLTPTFTSGKMKMMFETMLKHGEEMVQEMDKQVAEQPIDIKDILCRFTTDVIGSCAFGIECNSLQNPDNEYTKYLRLFVVPDWKGMLRGILTFVWPSLAHKLSVVVVNPSLSDFFMKMITDTVKYREKNNLYRKDFMHLLLQLKNRGELSEDEKILDETGTTKGNVKLTMNELAAQAFVFFLAGFETSSTAMTFCLYELALNPEIQEKLRSEVEEILEKHDQKLSYEAISEMKYMDQVVNETLRKYPPVPILSRECTATYTEPKTRLVIEKGTYVWISVKGLQNDPEFYPDPEVFDPERFSPENKKHIQPYTFLPFGEGPRICIGLRFGLMQTKMGLAMLLKNYRFSLNAKTQQPLKFDASSFFLVVVGGIWLNYEKI